MHSWNHLLYQLALLITSETLRLYILCNIEKTISLVALLVATLCLVATSTCFCKERCTCVSNIPMRTRDSPTTGGSWWEQNKVQILTNKTLPSTMLITKTYHQQLTIHNGVYRQHLSTQSYLNNSTNLSTACITIACSQGPQLVQRRFAAALTNTTTILKQVSNITPTVQNMILNRHLIL